MILYGLLEMTDDLCAAIADGSVALGGCTIHPENPGWRCPDCGHRWGESSSCREILDHEASLTPLPVPRFTIGRLMAEVAVSAEIFALFRMTNGTGPIGIMLLLPLISVTSLWPVRFARAGRWLLGVTWVAALWPLSIVAVSYATYGIATLALGGPPTYGDRRSPLDILRYFIIGSFLSSLAATLAAFYLPLCARGRSPGEAARWNPQTIPVLLIAPTWLLSYEILRLDLTPLRWFFD